ncbi:MULTISPECIES: GNAT family N-acetyltransferase [unclassified Lysobacter]|uniref:GNAT family N-acetyltransferase n=1 Tax=unclassified Lysobacter TaxID=2635362 RepID=UPI0007020D8F|nr:MULTISPECIES: GNAT family N-acetyltransferase [unclassified Lysobacter]KRA20444.1 hypothetical protein ASD69_03640 [Lysobacter sp. Root604]KRD39461.1 hypothetical protein ASE35_03655 [Lysobacter sp. Root916]
MQAPSRLLPFPRSDDPQGRDDRLATPALLSERGFALRPARDDDLPWLRTLYASTRAEELAPIPWPDEAKRAFLDSQFALQHQHYLLHYADADFLAIERDGAPVGRYYLQRRAPDHLIVDISLLTAARGQGIASALIEHSQRDAAALGRGLHLHVASDNAGAQRLYRRLGFVQTEDSGAHRRMRWPAP